MKSDAPRGVANRFAVLARSWLTAVIGLLAICFILGALDYSGDAKKFPIVVGIITAILAAIELVLAGKGRASPTERETRQTSADERYRALLLAGWFVVTVGGLYLLGLLATAFMATAVYFYVFVDRGPLRAIAFGGAHAALLWLAFDVLAGFRLYEGRVW